MKTSVARILGMPDREDGRPTLSDWARALGPLFAPFLILVCGVRLELLKTALCWSFFMIPGLLAVNLWFPAKHPLGRGVARLGVASVLAMFPFGILAWLACTFHWRLPFLGILYGLVYVAISVALVVLLARGRNMATEDDGEQAQDYPLSAPRWLAGVAIAGIALVLLGVVLSAPPSANLPDGQRFDRDLRPEWWHGAVLGGVGSLLAAGAVAFALGKARRTFVKGEQDEQPQLEPTRRQDARGRRRVKGADKTFDERLGEQWSVALIALIWLAAAGFTVHIMQAAYSVSVPNMEDLRRGALPWNVDDVAYVSEALDYLDGQPMGKYEPSLGGTFDLARSSMSPLTAPLVAMFAAVTGVSPAALHHSVMPPLVFLVGMSCLAAAVMTVLRCHRWAVPLGVLVAVMLIFKTWDYARCVVEMIVYRAMQTKSLHLLLAHPLQLATLVLLIERPSRRHFGATAAVATVGYGIHPLAAILGMVWATAMLVGTAVGRRKALPYVAALLVIYCGLGGLYHHESKRPKLHPLAASGRTAGTPIQSRDLVRVDSYVFSIDRSLKGALEAGKVTRELIRAFNRHDARLRIDSAITYDEEEESWTIGNGNGYRVLKKADRLDVYQRHGQPVLRHDPFWAFGSNTLFLAGALAVPLVLAFGVWRRELVWVGLIGAAVLLTLNIEPLGRLLNFALPTSIMWRARWFLPALVNVAVVAAVLHWAVLVLIRSPQHSAGMFRRFAASLVAIGAFGLMLYNTTSMPVRVGEKPRNLSKFSDDIHELVDLLGGTDASPYVFGPFLVQHELPQLMPNIRLVFSRDKFMRPAKEPNARNVALGVQERLSRGALTPEQLEVLLSVYPGIDHIVTYNVKDRVNSEKALEQEGWQRIARAGVYDLWRAPQSATNAGGTADRSP